MITNFCGFLVAFVLFGYSFFLKKIRHSLFSPDCFFCFLWGLISFFASLRLFGLWEISSFAWFLVALGVASFVFGAHFSYFFSSKPVYANSYKIQLNKPFNERLFFLLLIVLFIHVVPEFILSLRLLNKGFSLAELRSASFGNGKIEGINKSQIVLLVDSLFSSLKIIIFASGINQFFRYGKFKYIGPILGLIILDSFCKGGRFAFIYFLIEFLACYYLYKNFLHVSEKIHFMVKFLSILPLIMIVIISLLRSVTKSGSEVDGLIMHFYIYFCGCLSFFDQHIKNLNSELFSFSFAGLYGVWSQLFAYLGKFGVFDFPDLYKTTIFYHPFYDLRYVGVFIEMFLFGMFSQFIFKYVVSLTQSINQSINQSIVLYLIIIQLIFSSIHHYPGVSVIYVNTFLFYTIVKVFQIRII